MEGTDFKAKKAKQNKTRQKSRRGTPLVLVAGTRPTSRLDKGCKVLRLQVRCSGYWVSLPLVGGLVVSQGRKGRVRQFRLFTFIAPGHPHRMRTPRAAQAVPRLVRRTTHGRRLSYHTRRRPSVVQLRHRLRTSCARWALRLRPQRHARHPAPAQCPDTITR